MRATLSALVIAAALAGFGGAAQAAAVPTGGGLAGLGAESPLVQVQMTRGERMRMRHRVMRRHMMRRHMMRHRAMRHRMMHRRMRSM